MKWWYKDIYRRSVAQAMSAWIEVHAPGVQWLPGWKNLPGHSLAYKYRVHPPQDQPSYTTVFFRSTPLCTITVLLATVTIASSFKILCESLPLFHRTLPLLECLLYQVWLVGRRLVVAQLQNLPPWVSPPCGTCAVFNVFDSRTTDEELNFRSVAIVSRLQRKNSNPLLDLLTLLNFDANKKQSRAKHDFMKSKINRKWISPKNNTDWFSLRSNAASFNPDVRDHNGAEKTHEECIISAVIAFYLFHHLGVVPRYRKIGSI